jgi:hypothetical protein
MSCHHRQDVGLVQWIKASSTMRSVKVCFISGADFGYGLTCDEVDGFGVDKSVCMNDHGYPRRIASFFVSMNPINVAHTYMALWFGQT